MTEEIQARAPEIAEREHRSEYVRGLRQLASLIESNPLLPLPLDGSHAKWAPINILAHDFDTFRAAVRAIRGTKGRSPTGNLYVGNAIAGLHVRVTLFSEEEVCERVEVGTEKVLEQRVVREAEVEEVEVERPVYEWRCPPILAGEDFPQEVWFDR